MAVMHLLSWWYSRGWSWILGRTKDRLGSIADTFSVGTLLRTMFSPWKQIQSPTTFRTFIQSKVDNFISRFVGFTVRIGMLIGALFSFIAVLAVGLVMIILWPLLPLLVVLLPIMTLAGGN